MSPLLLNQVLVVSGDLHGHLLLGLDQELHPRLALLQEGLLLEQERLQLAVRRGGRTRARWLSHLVLSLYVHL